jgi:hypothetical protein
MRCKALALVALSASAAHADDTSTYRLEIGAADVGATAITVLGTKIDHPVQLVVGASLMMLAGPIVHAAHRDFGEAGASLGTNVALVAVGGIVAYGAACSGHDPIACGLGVVVGFGIGYIAAALIDITVITKDTSAQTAPRMIGFTARF